MDTRRQAPQLPEVKAAQARAAAIRWAIGKTVLGMIFLLGAMSHALGPQPRSTQSQMWTVLLIILSTIYVGLGLRTFAQARGRGKRLWVALTVAWGVAAAVMLRIVVSTRS
jgi:cation transport ATPase